MTRIIVVTGLIFVLASAAAVYSCHQLAVILEQCHPGIVATEHNGQRSTTIDCTKDSHGG